MQTLKTYSEKRVQKIGWKNGFITSLSWDISLKIISGGGVRGGSGGPVVSKSSQKVDKNGYEWTIPLSFSMNCTTNFENCTVGRVKLPWQRV
jgi:hypothetical protein